jgi:hypothetical protein
MNCSLCNLAAYVTELPGDDVFKSKHVGVMEQGIKLINCHNSVHFLVYYTYTKG